MSDLVDLLQSQAARIREEFRERIGRADVADLAQTMGEDCGPMLEAVAACLGPDDGQEAAARWARQLSQQLPKAELSQGQVLAGLSCFAQAVRHQAVVQIEHQVVLLAALQDLDEAIDALRRAYLAASSGEPEVLAGASGPGPGGGGGQRLRPPGHASRQTVLLEPGGPPVGRTGGEERAFLDPPRLPLRRLLGAAAGRGGAGRQPPRPLGRGVPTAALQDGALVDVQTTMLLVRDPATGKSGSMAIVHRLGKQREVALAEALAESEARKHAILESALDPIVTIDHQGVITEFNRAAESVFGHPRNTVLGTRPSEVLFPPASMAGQQVRIDRYLEAGEGSMLGKRTEVTAVRAGGETFPAELAMTLNYEHGKPLMTFFILRHRRAQAGERKAGRGTPPSWSGPTTSWNSSRMSLRTISRSRCEKSALSAIAWR